MSKPTAIPTWATSVVNDPTSGIDNRVAPSAGEQASGFVPLNVKPSRQHLNWLQWLNGQWIEYFDSFLNENMDKPKFDLPGTTWITYIAADDLIYVKTEADTVGSSTECFFNSQVISGTNPLGGTVNDAGVTLINKKFIKPRGFDTLRLDFRVNSVGGLTACHLQTLVIAPNASYIDNKVDKVQLFDIDGASLIAGHVWQQDLDLSGVADGDPLILLHTLIMDVNGFATDASFEYGPLFSSWRV